MSFGFGFGASPSINTTNSPRVVSTTNQTVFGTPDYGQFSGFGSNATLPNHSIPNVSVNITSSQAFKVEVNKSDSIMIRFDNFIIRLYNQIVYSSRMSLRDYVSCFISSYPSDKYRKMIKYMDNELIYMQTGPHVEADAKEFFLIDRTDYKNFEELRHSEFSSEICIFDDKLIIQKHQVIYHFSMDVEENIRVSNFNIGTSHKRKSSEEPENVKDAKTDNTNDE